MRLSIVRVNVGASNLQTPSSDCPQIAISPRCWVEKLRRMKVAKPFFALRGDFRTVTASVNSINTPSSIEYPVESFRGIHYRAPVFYNYTAKQPRLPRLLNLARINVVKKHFPGAAAKQAKRI